MYESDTNSMSTISIDAEKSHFWVWILAGATYAVPAVGAGAITTRHDRFDEHSKSRGSCFRRYRCKFDGVSIYTICKQQRLKVDTVRR